MGRPRLTQDEHTERLGFTLPKSLAEAFKRRAEELDMSQSELFRALLEKAPTLERKPQ